jgi:hypothetical protein
VRGTAARFLAFRRSARSMCSESLVDIGRSYNVSHSTNMVVRQRVVKDRWAPAIGDY